MELSLVIVTGNYTNPFTTTVTQISFTLQLHVITQFPITINSNVCPHIRVPNMLMRESYAWRHRKI